MAISIKYRLDENVIEYNNFDKIKRLTNYNDIVYINCYDNQLTGLPSVLPASLQVLNCIHNQLTELPSNLPASLQELYCNNNQLTGLPSVLPASLQIFDCSCNYLTELPSNLPVSLQKLYCENNHLTKLPSDLPASLQELNCGSNYLTELPSNLPASLQIFDCSYNYLTELPSNLPVSLQKLNCENNQLTKLPVNLHELRNLNYLYHDDNEIEYIPPHITRFLNRLRNSDTNKKSKIYDDGQNVHNHQIQESIRNSIYAVMKDKPTITFEELTKEIISNVILNEKTKQLLMEYCEDESVHSVMGITFKELLLAVWSIIKINKDKKEIEGIMNIEMSDADCKCFTGKMSRLINCLNTFDERVKITIADNDQISNIIIIEREKLIEMGNYSVEKHKENVKLAMKERNYKKETIEEWIEYIE